MQRRRSSRLSIEATLRHRRAAYRRSEHALWLHLVGRMCQSRTPQRCLCSTRIAARSTTACTAPAAPSRAQPACRWRRPRSRITCRYRDLVPSGCEGPTHLDLSSGRGSMYTIVPAERYSGRVREQTTSTLAHCPATQAVYAPHATRSQPTMCRQPSQGPLRADTAPRVTPVLPSPASR